MHIAYAAHTDACTFYLDDEGICRRVLRKRAKPLTGEAREDKAEKCLGAQYVASLDPATEGGLVALPRVGVPMLFAYVGEGGRIALVRTGPVVRFEQRGACDDDRPSQRETRPTLPGPEPTLEAKPDTKRDSGVRPRPEDEEIPVNVEPSVVEPPAADATTEMKTAPVAEPEEEDDGARTQMFRSSRPPRMSMNVPRASGNTPVPARPSWMPPTRVDRVSIVPVAPTSSTRELEPPSTERDPAPMTPRGRGMLPARASRGRG